MPSIGSVGGSTFLSVGSRQAYAANRYFESINSKYSKLKLRAADFRSTAQLSGLAKTEVFLSQEILALAESDTALAKQLEQWMGEIPGAVEALEKKLGEDSGKALSRLGFWVDKRGDLYCVGKIKGKQGAEKDFRMKLCGRKETSASLSGRILRGLETQVIGLDMLA